MNTKAQWDLLNITITPVDIIIDILQNNTYKLLTFVFKNFTPPNPCLCRTNVKLYFRPSSGIPALLVAFDPEITQ